jgi:hypothetical protein
VPPPVAPKQGELRPRVVEKLHQRHEDHHARGEAEREGEEPRRSISWREGERLPAPVAKPAIMVNRNARKNGEESIGRE